MRQHLLDLLDSVGEQGAAIARTGGGDICEAWRVTTSTGTLFGKTLDHPAPGMFEIEAAGLDWLAEAGAATPPVVAVSEQALLLQWLPPERPRKGSAVALGRMLAGVHRSPAGSYGTAPGGQSASSGWIGSLPMRFGDWPTWTEFYVHDRLRPTAAAAVGRGRLTAFAARSVEQLCQQLLSEGHDDLEPESGPARIHGDLWSGNLLWTRSGPFLIDPAAHVGHPETDLAMLRLFGAPLLSEIMTGYESVTPVRPGWQARTPLHQLFPVLVHAALFGGHYGQWAADLADTFSRNRWHRGDGT